MGEIKIKKGNEEKELRRIKKLVEDSRSYFKDNFDRFARDTLFCFKTAITQTERNILIAQDMPTIEFNMAEAYITRLLGEFARQEPSIEVRSTPGAKVDPQLLSVIEDHIRHELDEANQNCAQYDIYQDQMYGGFSCWKIWTDYENEMAFEQDIHFDRVFDPTLVGFSPLARRKTKSDSDFSYDIYPKTKEDFERENPGMDMSEVRFIKQNAGFNWSYSVEGIDILLVCDFYEKKKKKTKIVQLAPGWFLLPNAESSGFRPTMIEKEYEEALEKHKSSGRMEVPPVVVNKRETTITTVYRTRFIENKILEVVETDFGSHLPHIFVDGNSRVIKESSDAPSKQMTKGYTHNVQGVQKLKNYTGQVIANHIENMYKGGWLVPDQSLPDQQEYLQAWTNPQRNALLVHKTFANNDPNFPIPPPREINHPPLPPEVTAIFASCDNMMQMILGSFDASLGINDNQLSGEAVIQSATLSNAAAMPYIVGHLQALTQLGNCYVSLLPKFYKTPRTIPVLDKNGKRAFVTINQPGSPSFDFESTDLKVTVKAGVNFSIQKSQALRQIIAMMQASQPFAQFMNVKGLPILIDNLEIRGIDQLKLLAEEYQKELMQQQAQAANQPNPLQMKLQLEQQKIQIESQKNQSNNAVAMAKASVEQQQADTDRMRLIMEAGQSHIDNIIQMEKSQTEKTVHAMDFAMEEMKHHHQVNKDIDQHAHTMSKTILDHHAKTMRDNPANTQ